MRKLMKREVAALHTAWLNMLTMCAKGFKMREFMKQWIAVLLTVIFIMPMSVVSVKAENSSSDSVTEESQQSVSDNDLEDRIFFGHYVLNTETESEDVKNELDGKTGYQESDGVYYYCSSGKVYETVPLSWIVIEENDSSLILMQEYILESYAWDSDAGADCSSLTWSVSEMRSYLNSDTYLNKYFTANEQEQILTSNITNTAVGDSDSSVDNTQDKIYLASVEELQAWFSEGTSRIAYSYDYNNGELEDATSYWTRTPYTLKWGLLYPALVNSSGNITAGNIFNGGMTWGKGIRPVLAITKDSTAYSLAPSNVSIYFDSESACCYAGDDYSIPIKITGENVSETVQPYIKVEITSDTYNTETSNRKSIQIAEPGKYSVTCTLSGYTDSPCTASMILYVMPEIETITCTREGSEKVVISWLPTAQSEGYEICRSTSENGEYTVLYSGSVEELNSNNGAISYEDTTIEERENYWYKIRGLFKNDDGADITYSAVCDNVTAGYSDCIQATESNSSSANILSHTESDEGYEIIQRVPDFVEGEFSEQTVVSIGKYAEFLNVYIDGVKLVDEVQYTAESGSTRVTIFSETFAQFNSIGTHVITMEFWNSEQQESKYAVQTYTITADEEENSNLVTDNSSESNTSVKTSSAEAVNSTSNSSSEDSTDISSDVKKSRKYYVVVPGDMLYRIAARNGMKLAELLNYNPQIKNPNLIYPGQKIWLEAENNSTTEAASDGYVYYTIVKGDCMYKIAHKYGLTLRQLRAMNPVIAGQKYIYAGQKVRVQ